MHIKHHLHPPSGWYKWNTGASILETTRSTTISYFCRELSKKIIKRVEYQIGDCPILVTEMMASREE